MRGNLFGLPFLLKEVEKVFSFFMALATIFSRVKERVRRQAEITKERQRELMEKINGEVEGEENGEKIELQQDSGRNQRNVRTRVMAVLTAVVAFFEMLPLFLVLMLWIIKLLCIFAVVVVVFSIVNLIGNILDIGLPSFETGDSDPIIIKGGEITWTDEELASRGIFLSDYEKNFYRLGIFARKAIEGYGGEQLLRIGDSDKELAILMLLGVSSTETSMRFYSTSGQYAGKNPDITEIPSDIPPNSKGYGFFGLHKDETLDDKMGKTVASNIRKEYTPKGSYSYDAQYVPWAVLMGAKHLQTKIDTYIDRADTAQKINTALDNWGITHNRDFVYAFIAHCLAQAQYHGAYVDDHNAYINFLLAVYSLTSDNDEERSFVKWSLAGDNNNYSESAFRLAVLGSTPRESLGGLETPLEMTKSSKQTLKLVLNGEELNEPLWKVIWIKYGDKPEIQDAWETAQKFSRARDEKGKPTGYTDMVLNFHYGLNSYLQAVRIKDRLLENLLGGVTEGDWNFTATPGKGQAVVDGVSTLDYIQDWRDKNKSNTSATNLMNRFEQYWGTSSYLEDSSSLARRSNYVDTKFGVPFYGQGSRYGESYGAVKWHWGQDETFNYSGCMIYAHAYVASALTGRMVNPAEMASLMIVSDALVSEGIVSGKMPALYKKMGLKATRFEYGLGHMDEINETLENGGLAVVRMKNGRFTSSSGSNHFIVLNGIMEKDGVKYYSMYTSSSVELSMQLFDEQTIKKNMHLDAMIISK